MMKKCFLTAAAITMFAAINVFAEEGASEPSPAFLRARDFYAAGQYDSTIAILREFLRADGRNPEAFTVVPLITEAYMRRNEYGQALRLIEMYRRRFPSSPFLPRMSYLEGVALARDGKPTQALMSFSTAITLGLTQELFNAAISNAEAICDRSLSLDELSSLSSRGELHATLLEVVRFYEIQKLAASGQTVRARNSAEEFIDRYPRSQYAGRVRDLRGRLVSELRRTGQGQVQVGLLAPITGDEADIGRYVLQGVKLAIDAHNATAPLPVKFIVYDTRGNPVTTAQRSRDLLTKDQAQIAIGPVLSTPAVVSAAMFGGRDIIMVTPTASDDGISLLGDNIFQMNVTLGTMARRIATYAIDNLSIREFAIIAPRNTFGSVISEAFKEELQRRNIEVVHEDYFNEGTHDFTQVLRGLRNTLIRRRLEAIAAERGQPQTVTQISRADSIRYADSTFAIGGLFMPLATYEDVAKLAPQVVFQRLRTQMLGAGAWNDPRVLTVGSRHVNDAIIVSGVTPDTDSDEWKKFIEDYTAAYNVEPNRISALGYDAAQLVIRAVVESGDGDVAKLREALFAIQDYEGLSGKITIDPRTGSNVGAIIKKITENGFIRVE